jgi:hypothetical protein
LNGNLLSASAGLGAAPDAALLSIFAISFQPADNERLIRKE